MRQGAGDVLGLSKSIETLMRCMISAGPPANRPPHAAFAVAPAALSFSAVMTEEHPSMTGVRR
jgi:hypothetical protein